MLNMRLGMSHRYSTYPLNMRSMTIEGMPYSLSMSTMVCGYHFKYVTNMVCQNDSMSLTWYAMASPYLKISTYLRTLI